MPDDFAISATRDGTESVDRTRAVGETPVARQRRGKTSRSTGPMVDFDYSGLAFIGLHRRAHSATSV